MWECIMYFLYCRSMATEFVEFCFQKHILGAKMHILLSLQCLTFRSLISYLIIKFLSISLFPLTFQLSFINFILKFQRDIPDFCFKKLTLAEPCFGTVYFFDNCLKSLFSVLSESPFAKM